MRAAEVIRPQTKDVIRGELKSPLRRPFPIPASHTPVVTSVWQCHRYCSLYGREAQFSPAMHSTETTNEASVFKVKTQLVLHLEAN